MGSASLPAQEDMSLPYMPPLSLRFFALFQSTHPDAPEICQVIRMGLQAAVSPHANTCLHVPLYEEGVPAELSVRFSSRAISFRMGARASWESEKPSPPTVPVTSLTPPMVVSCLLVISTFANVPLRMVDVRLTERF